MKQWRAKLMWATDLILGEGPVWHEEWKCFLFVDIELGIVGRINPETLEYAQRRLGKKVGAVVQADNDKLIVALQGSIEEYDFNDGSLKQLTTIDDNKPDNRCNDGKCDARGRLWIGTMHINANRCEGSLYKFSHVLEKVIENVSISNGICWTKDNATMYYIDSLDHNIRAYDFDLEKGTVSNERIVVSINVPGHLPDGMCIDSEGMLWVAIWGGGCVNCYDPASGLLIGKIYVNAPNVTSCAFGGKDRKQLLITTARKGLSKMQLKEYPDSGSLFIVETESVGAETYRFKSSDGIRST